MKVERQNIGSYRGFIITKIVEILEESDYNFELQRSGSIGMPWVAELVKSGIGIPQDYYNVGGVNIFSGFAKLEYAKEFIDRIMNEEIDIYDDGLDYVDDSPAKYRSKSYCVNNTVTCDNCNLKNYGRDCKNNKII